MRGGFFVHSPHSLLEVVNSEIHSLFEYFLSILLATYYQTSIRRFRRNVRDDLQREVAKVRLETEEESADWINTFLSRFWLIYEPVLSASIIQSVDQVLADSTPAFLDSIRLTTFTLGTKPPRIDSVKTFPKTEPDVVVSISHSQKGERRDRNTRLFSILAHN